MRHDGPVRRTLVAVAIGAGWLVGTAAPAAAHSATGGPISTDWRSTLEAVTPAVTGVRVSVVDLSQRLELSNAGPTEVMVLGYHGEPYLRVGPAGVFENVRSPAHFLNRPGAAAGAPVPSQADPFA